MTESVTRAYETFAEFAPDWVAIPGDSIADLLDERGWSRAELAAKMDFTDMQIDLLLNGRTSIDGEISLTLERVLGGTARFWLNLDAQYSKYLASLEAVCDFAQQIHSLKSAP